MWRLFLWSIFVQRKGIMGNSESSHVIHVSCQSDRYQARSDGNPNESYIGIVVFTRLVLKEWEISQELEMLSHVALHWRVTMNVDVVVSNCIWSDLNWFVIVLCPSGMVRRTGGVMEFIAKQAWTSLTKSLSTFLFSKAGYIIFTKSDNLEGIVKANPGLCRQTI